MYLFLISNSQLKRIDIQHMIIIKPQKPLSEITSMILILFVSFLIFVYLLVVVFRAHTVYNVVRSLSNKVI